MSAREFSRPRQAMITRSPLRRLRKSSDSGAPISLPKPGIPVTQIGHVEAGARNPFLTGMNGRELPLPVWRHALLRAPRIAALPSGRDFGMFPRASRHGGRGFPPYLVPKSQCRFSPFCFSGVGPKMSLQLALVLACGVLALIYGGWLVQSLLAALTLEHLRCRRSRPRFRRAPAPISIGSTRRSRSRG